MMRNGLLVLGAIVIVAGCFLAAYGAWSHVNHARAVALGFADTDFNWTTAHAQDRGCNACHGDHLAADVSRLVVPRAVPELHGIFATSYNIPMRVEDCMICHDGEFAGNMHSLHLHSASFTNMGGNCDSCHATVNGKFVLYNDESRYSILNGVRTIPTPPFSQTSGEIRGLEKAAAAN